MRYEALIAGDESEFQRLEAFLAAGGDPVAGDRAVKGVDRAASEQMSELVEQLRAQTALVAAESERLRLSELRLRQGVSGQLDVLDAQRSLFATQQAMAQTRLARQRIALTIELQQAHLSRPGQLQAQAFSIDLETGQAQHGVEQLSQPGFLLMPLPVPFGLQNAMLDQHLRSHAHQFGIGA